MNLQHRKGTAWWAKTLPKEERGIAQPITERIMVSTSLATFVSHLLLLHRLAAFTGWFLTRIRSLLSHKLPLKGHPM